ncbi:MAG: hypothetical protein PHP20_05650 [Firmicutes bacterium]|nr:hypothetical protein [Bacillota bacterium]MDD4792532.1 hypothetical protein [Bacillota bacterium]
MYALMRDGFMLDVVVVALVTIVLGSFAAAGIAAAADRFFAHTVSGVVGEYGEYDLVVHVRTETRDESLRALKSTLRTQLPGARIRESATLLSRSNFLVSVPRKDEESMIALTKAVASIPGFAGYTLLLEPKVTVSGIGSKALPAFKSELGEIDGVQFILRDGGDIHLVCESPERVRFVAQAAEAVLRQYQVIDVSLTQGALATHSAHRGQLMQSISQRLSDVEGQDVAVRDLTQGGEADQAQLLTGAMVKIRAFLEAWAPQAVIEVSQEGDGSARSWGNAEAAGIGEGDSIILSADDRPIGSRPAPEDMVVSVTDVEGGRAHGIIVSGGSKPDTGGSSQILSAYLLDDGTVSGFVGSAQTRRPQEELSLSLSEAEELLAEYGSAVDDALMAAEMGEEALDSYERAIDSLISLQRALESLGVDGDAGDVRIDDQAVGSLLRLTEQALGAIESLQATADVVAMFSGSYDSLLANLKLWQSRLESFARRLEMIQSAASGAGRVTETLGDMSSSAAGILSTLHELDPASFRENLDEAKAKLAQMSEIDVGAMAEKVRDARSALPQFDGDEIVSSIGVIDKFVGDWQYSSDKVQLLVESELAPEEVAAAVGEAVGEDVLAVYAIPAGIVQPGVRSEVQTLLTSVKSTISGLAACAIIIVSLIVDHSTVIAGAIGLASKGQGARRPGFDSYVYGALAGGTSFYAIAAITRSTLGSLGGPVFAAIGCVLGLVAAGASLRMSPVSLDEIEACIAFGMTGKQIMREVIIPAGKPGVLSLLNRPHVVFDGTACTGAVDECLREGGARKCSQCAT